MAEGKQPITSIAELKAAGSAKMPAAVESYYNNGAMDMLTLRENEAAFDRFKLRPRILVDVSNVDPSTTLMGAQIAFPLGIAPAAMHGLAHPDGELATSKAAASTGIPMSLSTYSTTSLEDVAGVGSGNPYALQLSITAGRENCLRLIKKAEVAGYKALFITVDAPVIGRRLHEEKGPKVELGPNQSLPNFPGDAYVDEDGTTKYKPLRSYKIAVRDTAQSWQTFIPWIKANTSLEIWLKGIYCAEDAALAVRHELDGIIISNHGGRQLDGVPASVDALAECARVVKGRIKIGLDGGIRRGTDIFKAIALGADCCFIGRIPLWGLAFDGQKGVELAIDLLKEEFVTAMALSGCASIKDISRDHLSVLGANGLLCKL
ncbi:S-2-hydroxy-acid oxidase [Hypoxylon crocopeplum]|nr:S-2-hydroxy-acid oxidase [Hypoxylon crocopeplum]